jgi:hypothetical protein
MNFRNLLLIVNTSIISIKTIRNVNLWNPRLIVFQKDQQE